MKITTKKDNDRLGYFTSIFHRDSERINAETHHIPPLTIAADDLPRRHGPLAKTRLPVTAGEQL